jgi:glycerate 2-kinase
MELCEKYHHLPRSIATDKLAPVNTPRDLLLSAFQVALDAASPGRLIPPHLPAPPAGRTLVIGGGKAAASMARSVEENWPAASPLSGLVVTRHRHGLPTRKIALIEASHPLPDGRGADAAQHMLYEVQQLSPEDLLLVLLSGGGSSLLALPVDGVALEDLRALTKALLASGASIQEINTVRKHLTRFSGGQVAAMSSAPVVALILSDVVGNDPAHIASGPCTPDPTTYADALAILSGYAISTPAAVQSHLQRGLLGEIPDTPKPGDSRFSKVKNLTIGSAQQSLAATEAFMNHQGIPVILLGEAEGDSGQVAQRHAGLLRQRALQMHRPFALLSGGETTVTLRNTTGRGGRNTQYLLSLGLALRGMENVWGVACDTDGIDGTEDNAGAVWGPDTLARAEALGLEAEKMLNENNAYEFFRALNDLVITGPTRTNVNDFRLVLVT